MGSAPFLACHSAIDMGSAPFLACHSAIDMGSAPFLACHGAICVSFLKQTILMSVPVTSLFVQNVYIGETEYREGKLGRMGVGKVLDQAVGFPQQLWCWLSMKNEGMLIQ